MLCDIGASGVGCGSPKLQELSIMRLSSKFLRNMAIVLLVTSGIKGTAGALLEDLCPELSSFANYLQASCALTALVGIVCFACFIGALQTQGE